MTPPSPRLGFTEAHRAAGGMRQLREAADLDRAQFGALVGRSLWWVKAAEGCSTRLRRAEADEVAAALGTDFPGLLAAGERARAGAR